MLSCNKCHMCIFHSFIEQNMLGNEPLYYIFGIWSLNSSLNIRFNQFQKISKLMVLYERLQMLYEPKIRVTGSFRKLLHILYEKKYRFFMRQMQFRPDTQSQCIFAPINGPQYEISNNVVCVSTKGLDQPAHMCSLIRAFASRLKSIDRLAFEVS